MKKTTETRKPFRFKKWNRAGYSAFASMHRHVTIGVLSVGMSIIATKGAIAQELATSEQNHRLDSVTIWSEKTSPTRSVMAITPIVTRLGKTEAPAQTLEALLRTTPSVDVRERGGKAVQADISIRGGSFDQTQVMLNGITFTDVRTGHQTHSLPIDVDVIGSIELLDGVQGVGAYAGAINFKTQIHRDTRLTLKAEGGAHGYAYTNLSGSFNSKHANYFAAASFRHSDGYRPNTGFDNVNLYTRALIDTKKAGSIDIQAGGQTRSFGANGFYSLKYPNQFEHTETALASARWAHKVKTWEFSASSSWRGNTDRFELIKGDESKVPFNYHYTHNIGAEAFAAKTTSIGKTTLGADWTFNLIRSTVLGKPMSEPKGRYTKEGHRASSNFWLRHAKSWKKASLGLSGGLALTPYGNSAMGSAEAAIYPLTGMKVYAGAVRSMRLPTFNDLYYTAAGYLSNDSLEPEKAITGRIGATYSNGGIYASALTYVRRGENIIDWVKYPGEDIWKSMQLTRMTTTGAELTAGWRSETGILRSAQASYGYINNDKSSGECISKYALDYMRNKLSIFTSISPFDMFMSDALKGIKIGLSGSFYDRVGNYTTAEGEQSSYKPYFLLDGRISWSGKSIQVYAEATNLTSTAWFDYGGLPMPRIWANAGIILTL